MSTLLLAHPDWVTTVLAPDNLRYPRQEQGLRREVSGWFNEALRTCDYSGALAKLRQFKQREMLRIAARDLARLADAPQITREISNVADVCLTALLQLCQQQLTARFGQPYYQDPAGQLHPTGFAVIGLGKLGGQELNYSSDVDVVFVYAEEGTVFKEAPSLGAEFLEMGQPFRFPRSLSVGFLSEVAPMKTRMENEVVRAGEIERNVKLGRGGIREIEFVVQTLQLLHAGRIPFLQTHQTLAALQKLREYKLLSEDEILSLSTAYCFLRDLEHRLQMEHNLQTHTVPVDVKARERLGRLMGFKTLAVFES